MLWKICYEQNLIFFLHLTCFYHTINNNLQLEHIICQKYELGHFFPGTNSLLIKKYAIGLVFKLNNISYIVILLQFMHWNLKRNKLQKFSNKFYHFTVLYCKSENFYLLVYRIYQATYSIWTFIIFFGRNVNQNILIFMNVNDLKCL